MGTASAGTALPHRVARTCGGQAREKWICMEGIWNCYGAVPSGAGSPEPHHLYLPHPARSLHTAARPRVGAPTRGGGCTINPRS
eukprot:gene11158-biopygen1811